MSGSGGFRCVLLCGAALAAAGGPVAAVATGPRAADARSAVTRYRPDPLAGRAGAYYRVVWGVEALSVKLVESGELIRFSYRVVDGGRAAPLNDARAAPSLVDPQAGVSLVVPSMENVGQLRQTGTPEAGHEYWMTFSNKGRVVKRGDHVGVICGQFHADGLVVN